MRYDCSSCREISQRCAEFIPVFNQVPVISSLLGCQVMILISATGHSIGTAPLCVWSSRRFTLSIPTTACPAPNPPKRWVCRKRVCCFPLGLFIFHHHVCEIFMFSRHQNRTQIPDQLVYVGNHGWPIQGLSPMSLHDFIETLNCLIQP